MAVIRGNNVFGAAGVLTDSGTTLTSAGLANLPVVSGSDIARVVLDPDRVDGAPEIVHVTAHTAAATTATILRGREGTTARAHAADTPWVHSETVQGLTSGNVLGGAATVAEDCAVHPGATANNSSIAGRGSTAVGQGASAGPRCVSVGRDATTSDRATAVGWAATTSTHINSVVVGNGASVASPDSTAVGSEATAGTSIGFSTSVGRSASSVREATAIGGQANASATDAVAVGRSAVASHTSSVALGRGTATTATNQVMIGPRDLEITGIVKGIVLVDRTLGTRHRIYLDNGALAIEAA